MVEVLEESKKPVKTSASLWEKFKNNRKAQIAVGLIAVIIMGLLILGGYMLFSKKDKTESGTPTTETEVQGQSTYRKIDGVLTEEAKANLLPVAIVVENYKDVRPQNGLSSANVVYEALAEGGITRFLAIYSDGTDIKTIGPVRSARHYFVDIAEEYGGLFAHIGGSPQALGVLSYQDYITDLNQFGYSQYYWRDEAIPAPHNLFTSTEMMSFAIRDLIGENVQGDYDAWQFADEAELNARPETEINVKINYGLDDYAVEWKYNKENNIYQRLNAGAEHKDKNTDSQITAKNMIVQFAETSLIDTERLDIKTIGEGDALIFVNGESIIGTWKKEERGARTKYFDENGEEVEFARGNTWVQIVKQETAVEWIDAEGDAQKKN
jgi:hypothetical protein